MLSESFDHVSFPGDLYLYPSPYIFIPNIIILIHFFILFMLTSCPLPQILKSNLGICSGLPPDAILPLTSITTTNLEEFKSYPTGRLVCRNVRPSQRPVKTFSMNKFERTNQSRISLNKPTNQE